MALLASVIENYQQKLEKAADVAEHGVILAHAIAYLSAAGPEDLEVLESVVGSTSGDLAHVIKRLIAFLKRTPPANFSQKKLVWTSEAPSHEISSGRSGQWSLVAV